MSPEFVTIDWEDLNWGDVVITNPPKFSYLRDTNVCCIDTPTRTFKFKSACPHCGAVLRISDDSIKNGHCRCEYCDSIIFGEEL